ncbi:MAG: hypothetical protein WCB19_05670 [Thermoplasmata archaeon]
MSDTHPERKEVVKALNRRLREAGLNGLSAAGGKGTAWGWIDIRPKHNEGESYRTITPEESVKLAELFGGEPGRYRSNVVSDEMDDWAVKLGMIRREDYRESPWRQLQRENRD